MGLKEAFLQKGWAGKTISRAETIDRVNPLLKEMVTLLFAYEGTLPKVKDGSVAEALQGMLRIARMDAGKLAETVFSCGGTAYSGTDLEVSDFEGDAPENTQLQALRDREQALLDGVSAEAKIEHQMRTRAILGVVQQNIENRLRYLNNVTGHRN